MKGLSIAKNCLRPDSALLREPHNPYPLATDKIEIKREMYIVYYSSINLNGLNRMLNSIQKKNRSRKKWWQRWKSEVQINEKRRI